MHSFHPSRGRISFEVLCALGIAASCATAWMQTGASALLAAAGVSALYGLVHFFDLFRRRPVAEVEPQRIEFEPVAQAGPAVARQEERPRLVAVAPEPAEETGQPVVERPADETAPSAKSSRRVKAPRKSSGRKAGGAKAAKVLEAAPYKTPETEAALPQVESAAETEPFEEPFQAPVAPLFEPEPFVRQQQRAMFGRKAR